MRWPALTPTMRRRKWLWMRLLLTDIVDARGESLMSLIAKTSSRCLQMVAEVCRARSLGHDSRLCSMLPTLRMVPWIASHCMPACLHACMHACLTD